MEFSLLYEFDVPQPWVGGHHFDDNGTYMPSNEVALGALPQEYIHPVYVVDASGRED
ncbi:MAG: hypothetical protein ACR2O7_07065 [Parasphingorhabdus sp.]|jgi:hypothetical protein